MGLQRKSNTATLKTVALHGRCGKCGMYVTAKAAIGPLEIELPNEATEWPHTHLTMVCWRCGCLINLVDVEKEPLKNKRSG